MHAFAELYALESSVLSVRSHTSSSRRQFARGEFGEKYLLSPRDEQRKVKESSAARSQRALANFVENYAPFVAVDLGLIATGTHRRLGRDRSWIARAHPLSAALSRGRSGRALRSPGS